MGESYKPKWWNVCKLCITDVLTLKRPHVFNGDASLCTPCPLLLLECFMDLVPFSATSKDLTHILLECGHSEECEDSEHRHTKAMLENNFRSSDSHSPWHCQYASITFRPCLPLSLSSSFFFASHFSVSSSLPSGRSPSTQREITWTGKTREVVPCFVLLAFTHLLLKMLKNNFIYYSSSSYSLDFSIFLPISRLFFPLFICQIFTPCLLFTINVPFPLPHHLF